MRPWTWSDSEYKVYFYIISIFGLFFTIFYNGGFNPLQYSVNPICYGLFWGYQQATGEVEMELKLDRMLYECIIREAISHTDIL